MKSIKVEKSLYFLFLIPYFRKKDANVFIKVMNLRKEKVV